MGPRCTKELLYFTSKNLLETIGMKTLFTGFSAFLGVPTNVGFVKRLSPLMICLVLTNSAETLFSKDQASNHCLHALLPEKDPKLHVYSQK